jgi:4-alpha-glucanotransferase
MTTAGPPRDPNGDGGEAVDGRRASLDVTTTVLAETAGRRRRGQDATRRGVNMSIARSSGILLHPTSLPGKFGIGDLGPRSVSFLDYLADAGQGWWQMLPLGPVGMGYSPYQSSSSFAGNPLLISPERVIEMGLLGKPEIPKLPRFPEDHVAFPAVAAWKELFLRRAFLAFGRGDAAYRGFGRDQDAWLDDFALFQALHHHHGGVAWSSWPAPLAHREPAALRAWREQLKEEVRYHKFVQFLFHVQWAELRAAAAKRRIRMIGDIPIFVSYDSADVWARPELFELDAAGQPMVVAGVPPDYFAAEGQLWGNPLYRWHVHESEGYAWWIDRIRAQLERVDLIRLDHFRGFEAYWEIPASAPTAATGRWVPGPGDGFFVAVRNALGSLPLIAEDLGDITPAVHALRDRFGLPGMKVLQFAFGPDAGADTYLPHTYPRDCVVYTGTHDNDTTNGWFHATGESTTQSLEELVAERRFVCRYTGADGSEVHWDLIRLAQASVANLAIVPMQDVLGLGSEARMNVPGRAEGNWTWRCRPADLRAAGPRKRLAEMAVVFGRYHGVPPQSLRVRRAETSLDINRDK